MRPDRVVVMAPLLDQDLRFAERAEGLAVEQFIPEAAVLPKTGLLKDGPVSLKTLSVNSPIPNS